MALAAFLGGIVFQRERGGIVLFCLEPERLMPESRKIAAILVADCRRQPVLCDETSNAGSAKASWVRQNHLVEWWFSPGNPSDLMPMPPAPITITVAIDSFHKLPFRVASFPYPGSNVPGVAPWLCAA
jgi:hypothetical protein